MTTNTPQHTPGPWNIKNVHEDFQIIEDTKGNTICALYEDTERGDSVTWLQAFNNVDENARLIASAPETAAERDALKIENAELRKALEALYNSFQHDGQGRTKGNQAKTDVITHNEDVRAALTLARNIIHFGKESTHE